MYILYSCTFITTIPDWSQSRAQKNFFSLKGFSEVGTGVIRGSSQACASQYAIRSAAAFDTFILQKLASIFSCSTSFLAWPTLMVLFTGVSPFIPYYIPLQVQSSPLFSLFFPLFCCLSVSLCKLMFGGISVAGHKAAMWKLCTGFVLLPSFFPFLSLIHAKNR